MSHSLPSSSNLVAGLEYNLFVRSFLSSRKFMGITHLRYAAKYGIDAFFTSGRRNHTRELASPLPNPGK
jgi:hypothetical protein